MHNGDNQDGIWREETLNLKAGEEESWGRLSRRRENGATGSHPRHFPPLFLSTVTHIWMLSEKWGPSWGLWSAVQGGTSHGSDPSPTHTHTPKPQVRVKKAWTLTSLEKQAGKVKPVTGWLNCKLPSNSDLVCYPAWFIPSLKLKSEFCDFFSQAHPGPGTSKIAAVGCLMICFGIRDKVVVMAKSDL